MPRKNLKALGGVPLIGWTIRAAREAKRLTRVIVSTDDAEIAAAAKELGADVPFVRPADLATDSARAIPVIQHAVEALERSGDAPYDAVLMLQPTTPFRSAADIDAAIEKLEATRADSVISVIDVGGTHPARMKYLEGDRLIDPPFCEAYENQPRQELKPMYLRNGAIYLTRSAVLRGGSFKGQDCRALVMPEERSTNIDTLADFRLAEFQLEEARR